MRTQLELDQIKTQILKKLQCPLSLTHNLLVSKPLTSHTSLALLSIAYGPFHRLRLAPHHINYYPRGHHTAQAISIRSAATKCAATQIAFPGLTIWHLASASHRDLSNQSWVFYCKGGFTFTSAYHGLSQYQDSVSSHETLMISKNIGRICQLETQPLQPLYRSFCRLTPNIYFLENFTLLMIVSY